MTEGISVIAGLPPIDLQIIERRERYTGVDGNTARQNLMRKWQHEWENGKYGRWTYSLIPAIERWINRAQGEVDYFITQALSGHGCYRKYLYERRKVVSRKCTYCDQVDDVEHTLFACSRWNEYRNVFYSEVGNGFSPVSMMDCLLNTETTWKKAYKTIRSIIEVKEREERLNRIT